MRSEDYYFARQRRKLKRKVVRSIKKRLTRHHRKPRSRNGSDDESNISYLTKTQHQAWHCLFQDLEPKEIVRLINSKFIDPDYFLVAVRRENAR